jgi:hypothetical protein
MRNYIGREGVLKSLEGLKVLHLEAVKLWKNRDSKRALRTRFTVQAGPFDPFPQRSRIRPVETVENRRHGPIFT